jgi:putative endonuclease
MHYAYVPLSDRDGRCYIGSTSDLRERLQEHRTGRAQSTAYRRPLRLVYYEACPNPQGCAEARALLEVGKRRKISQVAPGLLALGY